MGIKSLMLSKPGMATEPVPAVRLGRVHFTGIGGAGMSGIARIMLARGIQVSGSDSMPSALLDDLHAHGARVYLGHEAGHLGDLGLGDTLVLSSAIRADNPELAEATRRGMRILHRASALASVMAGRRVIAVAGTHGKTTTTSMLTTVLRECGADPGYVIGGILNETGLGAEDGAGMDFVAEADESDGSFLLLSPDVAVITNVEADHLDNYASLAEIEAAFDTFAGRVSGMVLTCADDPGAEAVAAHLEPLDQARVRRYGESMRADYRLSDIKPRGMTVSFAVSADRSPFGELLAQMTVQVPGRHNALNATAAFATAVELGFAPPRVTAALAGYRGARRRLELKGEAGEVRVLDSYAHHPTELAADLRAARDIVAGASSVAEGSGGSGAVPPGASSVAEGSGGSGGSSPRSQQRRRRAGRDQHCRRPGHRHLPAAPVQPDADFRRRVRRRARARRRGGGARRLCGPRGPGTRRDRPAGGRRRARREGQVPARPDPDRPGHRPDRGAG